MTFRVELYDTNMLLTIVKLVEADNGDEAVEKAVGDKTNFVIKKVSKNESV